MNTLNKKNAKKYALEHFKKMSEIYFKWNMLHSEEIIEVLTVLTRQNEINTDKLFALAWIHDIGKIKSDENHARLGIEILKEDFYLDKIDIDCILNHGSSGNPQTKEGRLFRYADGLSIFTNKSINFRFFAESKEGMKSEEINDKIKKLYEKYKKAYSDSEEILIILDDLYTKNVE